MNVKGITVFARRFATGSLCWILLQFLIGPIAYLNSKVPIPDPLLQAMEKSIFLPAWLATRDSRLNNATLIYVRWWVPAPNEGWCCLEMLPADTVVDQEPRLTENKNTTNQEIDAKGSVTAH
jgi:hypothetical protein